MGELRCARRTRGISPATQVELLDETDFFRRRSFDSSGKTLAKLHRGNQAKDALDQADHGSSKPP
ncbi:hypothetical protein ABIF78_008999 [Bradyrhizobium japonicum]